MSELPEVLEVSPAVGTKASLKSSDRNGDGFINIGGAFQGHYSKCVATLLSPIWDDELQEEFEVDAVINRFFEENPGRMIVSIIPFGDSALVTHTKTMSPEEIGVISEFGEEINKKLQEKMAAEAEARAVAAAAKEAREKEESRLAHVGRVCEKAHQNRKTDAKGGTDAP